MQFQNEALKTSDWSIEPNRAQQIHHMVVPATHGLTNSALPVRSQILVFQEKLDSLGPSYFLEFFVTQIWLKFINLKFLKLLVWTGTGEVEGYSLVQLRWEIEGFPQELERVKNLEKVRRLKRVCAPFALWWSVLLFFGGRTCLR